jgi:tellurite resistance protein TerC
MWITTLTQAKRVVKIVVGFTVLAAGAAMLLLPGPGLVTIAIGLAILSAEFVWARRWLEHMKRHAGSARDLLRGRRKGV